MCVLPLSTKSIKIFYILFRLLFKIYEIQHSKKKKSWNKAKETLFVIEVFMEWFEEQHTGITRVWCRLLNPIQHLLYLVNRNVVVLILIFYRAVKKKLILNKQFLFSSLERKGHLNLLSDSQAAVVFPFTCSGLMSHHFRGLGSLWTRTQNWENNLIYHVTIPIIICAPKALPFHPLLQMFLHLKIPADSYRCTTTQVSLEHWLIKLNILFVLWVKCGF